MDKYYQESEKKIHVNNIPKTVDSKALQTYFKAFGPVVSAIVIGANKRKCQCYGFVAFASEETVQRVLATSHRLNGNLLGVEIVSQEKAFENLVSYASGHEEHLYLFLPNIPKDLNKEKFLDHFNQFGELTQARLVRRPEKTKDLLYLQYKDISSVNEAKAKRHRITGLTSETVTFVCKVGIFNSERFREIMKEAVDLLTANVSRSTASSKSSSSNCSISPGDLKVDSMSKAPGHCLLPGPQQSLYPENKDSSRGDTLGTGSLPKMDESPANYRFNVSNTQGGFRRKASSPTWRFGLPKLERPSGQGYYLFGR